ncbi:hypothetical protein O6H91_02G148700 [Diphasiastrum complanatum]|uniref:Uncharacterized protein n=1 Tax=Diphasiastrum complanatum TaxID=34168 RepID=A0ACC2EM43_DIPCM|nr:hypothetical protein O6H91_Y357500 [Diphasiastrum complanatum]KAJ7567458.1 hypothetical protein O6H91_02G148700 [Diphasiastrum complanatum]
MNAVLYLVVFWFLALALVFEKNVNASRMREAFVKPESKTSTTDHILRKQAVESIEPPEKFAKEAGTGIGAVEEGLEVVSETESEQPWLSRQVITKNASSLSSAAELPSARDQREQLTARKLNMDEIDYSGPSTHPPPEGH